MPDSQTTPKRRAEEVADEYIDLLFTQGTTREYARQELIHLLKQRYKEGYENAQRT